MTPLLFFPCVFHLWTAMDGPAHIGVELPCRRSLPAGSCVLVFMDEQPIHLGGPSPGRLCPPRRVVRAVKTLLREHRRTMRERARQLAARDPAAAQALWDRTKAWMADVRTRHLAPHRMRVPLTDRFKAFAIPEVVRLQLLRQIFDQRRPGDPAVQLCLVVPVAPCLRLLDKVAVYLHAPSPLRQPRCTGDWWAVPEHHVQVGLVGAHVAVLVV
jgi:hypothetical protein